MTFRPFHDSSLCTICYKCLQKGFCVIRHCLCGQSELCRSRNRTNPSLTEKTIVHELITEKCHNVLVFFFSCLHSPRRSWRPTSSTVFPQQSSARCSSATTEGSSTHLRRCVGDNSEYIRGIRSFGVLGKQATVIKTRIMQNKSFICPITHKALLPSCGNV